MEAFKEKSLAEPTRAAIDGEGIPEQFSEPSDPCQAIFMFKVKWLTLFWPLAVVQGLCQ
jgi:hypothetical protein